MRYYHDLSEDEVAGILGCPRGTVKSRLHYAMTRLLELARDPHRAEPAHELRRPAPARDSTAGGVQTPEAQ